VNLTWRLAWRNLWRHRRRTWLTVSAMVVCNVLLIFLIGLQLGSYDVMIEGSLGPVTGHLQVQRAGFQEDQRIRDSVPAAAALAHTLRQAMPEARVGVRGTAFALASSESRSFGIQLQGVQAAREPGVSTLPGMLAKGRYLRGEGEEIVVGRLLARNLQAQLGDQVVLLGSGRDGSMAAAVARLVGVVDSGIAELDRALAQSVFAMDDHAHALVLRLPHLEVVPAAKARVEALLPAGGELVVLDWDQLQPGLRQAIRTDMVSAWFLYGVLVLLVAFSVLNTQLMSVLERTREFGVMLALGLGPGRLARLVAMETALLGGLGLVLGILFGTVLTLALARWGFTYPGMEEVARQFNLPARLYPRPGAAALLVGPGVVFAGALLAALYPALRLYRLQPVAAMRAV
jgi:ABC-type lipoprotein release transport system permease subunit